MELYEHLHLNPELPLREVNTSERIAKELESAGYTVTRNVGGHGLVGVLKNGDGPVVMVRTDLDGLPVIEETGLAYASKVRTKDIQGRDVGVMHACGHDVHMTSFVGTARLLSQLKQHWRGTLAHGGAAGRRVQRGIQGHVSGRDFQEISRCPTTSWPYTPTRAWLPVGFEFARATRWREPTRWT